MVKSLRVVGGGLLDYTVSFLGQVIVIVISRPRSLTIIHTDVLLCMRDRLVVFNIFLLGNSE